VIIDQRVTIPAPIEKVWDFMMDVPAVSLCVPNVERFVQTGPDVYDGTVGVKVGPVSVHLEGRITVGEQDRETWTARLDGDATDRRIRGAVSTRAWMRLQPRDDGQTEMHVHADAAILGKLGQFGQAVLRKKAEQVVAEFVRNMSERLTQPDTAVRCE
jgi:uncharacterized protein